MFTQQPAVVSLLAMLPFAVQAENVSLEPLVVTATRIAQTADDTLSAVSVLNREDIERLQAQSLPDLLRLVAGLNMASNGSDGKTTSLFMRGTESGHVLVLIDGVRVGSATTGTTAFEHLPISVIDHIEVVRGPRSSLYGSEAIGGVVQIFTRHGGSELKPTLAISGGSYHSYGSEASVNAGDQKRWLSVSASSKQTDGINVCGNAKKGCAINEPDKDGYHQQAGSVRAGYQLSDSVKMDVQALQATGWSKFDGASQNQAATVQQVLGVAMQINPTVDWGMDVKLGQSRDDSDNFKDGVFKSRFNTRRDTVSLQHNLILTRNNLLIMGADYQHEQIDSTTKYVRNERENQAVFVQYQTAWQAQRWQGSWRSDDNEQFGRHNTASVAWGMDLGSWWSVRASTGSAFKAPTFNELYYPSYGNANLQPTRSRSHEVGMSFQQDKTRADLSVFVNDINDLITYDAAIKAPNNVSQAMIKGIEANVYGSLMASDWQAAWTYLDPENRMNGANYGKDLSRRPRQTLRVQGDTAKLGPLSLGLTLNAEGRRFDDLANTTRVGGFTTVDLRAEYRINPAWRLQMRLDNVFDKHYQTIYSYNQLGRGVFFTLRYQP